MEVYIFVMLLAVVLFTQSYARPIKKDNENKKKKAVGAYLKKYGYMERDEYGSQYGGTPNGKKYNDALYVFALYNRIKTQKKNFKFAKPYIEDVVHNRTTQRRCGDPDIGQGGYLTTDEQRSRLTNTTKSRSKRYVANLAWDKSDLTYSVSQYSTDTSLSQADQDQAMLQASQLWSCATTGLTITKWDGVTGTPDIVIEFATLTHQGCSFDFDGTGAVVAHGYYPNDGRVHFDDDESYTTGNDATKLFLISIAAHEFGHALGMGHSAESSAVMHATYKPYDASFALSQDDIDGITYLYPPIAGCSDAPWCEDYVLPDECSTPSVAEDCPDTCDTCP